MTDKDFVWRDNYSRNNDKQEDNLESYENIKYEAAIEELQKKYARIVKIAAAVFLIFITLLTVLFFKSRYLADYNQIATIEKRLDQLDADFTSLKTYIASKLDQAIKEMERDRRIITRQNAPSAKTAPAGPTEQEALKPKVHKVLPGESLARIGRYYGLTVKQLRLYNNLESDSIIHPGEELKLTP